jgi:tropinone reductase I
LVTGGSKGIGQAIVKELLKHQSDTVFFCSRRKTPDDGLLLESYQNSFPESKVYHIVCDVATTEGRKLLIDTCRQHVPALHGLVNNVGVNVRKPMTEQTAEEYYTIMRTNIDSAYFLCQLFLPLLENATADAPHNGSAAIVNVSSAAGLQSSGTGVAYGMSKAALNQMTRSLACEWAGKRIRVNSIAPWMTWTPMLQQASAPSPTGTPSPTPASLSVTEKAQLWTPMQRLAEPHEIAAPAVFLLMEASSYITGQTLAIDGGLTAQGFAGPTTSS